MKQLNLIFISFLILFPFLLSAQTPTVQDCSGAIPLCQSKYHEDNSYSGMGNYPNEIDSTLSCTYEDNSVWYTFTAQTNGNFSFILTPNDTLGNGDNYDWTVFDLTNAACSEIFNNPSLEISCNSWGDTLGFNGPTGASTAMGGYGNNNGPGTLSGPPWNADIPVVQGGTYMLMVSNRSGSNYGYTIDFSSSTAQLYDNVRPQIHAIISNITCGDTSISFDFSKNILCSTIATCDISLTGPGGPYTITSITGPGCASGGNQEKDFTINFTPPIHTGGSYSLNLNASSCNSVSDPCGNIAFSGSLPFNLSLVNTFISTTAAFCTSADGSASVIATGGTGNYTYQWNTIPPQTSDSITNITSGVYIVTVSDGNCTGIDTAFVPSILNFSASIINVINETCGMSDGSATVSVTGGTLPITYQWSTNPPQYTATASNLPAGQYSINVSDASGCSVVLNVTITVGGGISAIITVTDSHCDQADGSATAYVTGGSGNYSFLWSNGDTSSTVSNLTPGLYTVAIDDGFCNISDSVTITNQPGPKALFTYLPNPISINHPEVTFTSTSMNVISWIWDFGDSTGFFYGESLEHTYLTVRNFNVTLIVTDSFGCTDTITEMVVVHDIFTIYIPNSFTPDGDGTNDYFEPYGISWEEGTYQMIIYNRWGSIVYQTTDYNKPWNGGVNNNPSRKKMVPGVYVYLIKVKGINYREKEYIGRVSLLR